MTSREQIRRAIEALHQQGISIIAGVRPDGYVEVAVTASPLPSYPTHVVVVRELRAEHIDFFLRR